MYKQNDDSSSWGGNDEVMMIQNYTLDINIGITLMIYLRVLLGTNYFTQRRSCKRIVCDPCNKRKMNTDAVAADDVMMVLETTKL